jgi:hypothetical protein
MLCGRWRHGHFALIGYQSGDVDFSCLDCRSQATQLLRLFLFSDFQTYCSDALQRSADCIQAVPRIRRCNIDQALIEFDCF